MLKRLRNWVGPRPSLLQLANLAHLALAYAVTNTWYRVALCRIGKRTVLDGARFYGDGRAIEIGDGVTIRPNTRIEAVSRYAGLDLHPRLTIGNDTNIEQNCHIVCGERVAIGNGVSITAGCAIVDIVHPHDSGEAKIGASPVWTNPVEIGDGSFLGTGVVVLPGTRVGRRVVIGANAVVAGELPDFTIWAGNPARCVMAYTPAQTSTVTSQ